MFAKDIKRNGPLPPEVTNELLICAVRVIFSGSLLHVKINLIFWFKALFLRYYVLNLAENINIMTDAINHLNGKGRGNGGRGWVQKVGLN